MIRQAVIGALVAGTALWAIATACADETTLIFATINPPPADMNQLRLHPWADAVNKAGAGVLHIDVRDGNAIADHANFYNRVLDDVIQIAFGSQSYIGGKFPRSEVVSLPFGPPSAADGSQAFWRLYASGILKAEYDEIQPLVLFSFPQQSLHFAKKPASPTAVKGLKFVTSSRVAGQVMTALGASPMSFNAQDVFTSLQRGMADGVMFPWTAMAVFKLPDVTSYQVDTSLGGAPGMLFMSKKKYLALPPAARKILDETSGEMASRRFGETFDQESEDELAKLKGDQRQTIVALTAAQNADWKKQTKAVLDQWEKETPDGAAVLAKYNDIIANLSSHKAE